MKKFFVLFAALLSPVSIASLSAQVTGGHLVSATPGSIASISAQETVIAADTTSHNFGDISEKGGDISHIFIVRNAGDAPMIITRVTASCGCTTPEWSQEPIIPGGQGEIKVTYSPLNRPGAFHKTISVYSNGAAGAFYLTITGNVVP
ncbi:MAG: DUF1573 domain-containing protein [Tannerellaceae bacterium]|jgi:hypothetical protein|nr:DUF1573 domain-containing protein [Tannerellaceae bacterium]